jgi:hypothetical protein
MKRFVSLQWKIDSLYIAAKVCILVFYEDAMSILLARTEYTSGRSLSLANLVIKIRFIDWFCLSSLILWIENIVWLATTNRIMLVSITEVGRHSPYVRIVWPPCQHTVASFIIMLRADYDTEKLPYLPWDTNISIPNISMEITLYIMSYESRSTVKLLILLKLNLQSCSSTCCVHLDCYHTESVDLVAILAKEIA